MKLRNIFTSLAVAALAFVGCQEGERFLDEVQVSQSTVSIDVEGGSAEITVTATADWKFAEIKDVWPEFVQRDEDGKVTSTAPSWLKVDVTSGAAGETKVTFSAEATKETRELNLGIECAGATQQVTVLQMAAKVEVPLTDCATVLKENNIGKVYKCKGTITDLTNYDKYGCFYINDGTATVYVYGSMNPTQFSPEVGDIISFEGPWTSYGNFDDVTILSLEKSLIKAEKVIPATALPKDGGVATVLLTIKEGDLEIVIPEDAAWLTAGEPGTVGGMTSVELTAAANEAGARSTTVTFKVNVGGKDYIAMVDIDQLGAIAEVSVADFLEAPEGTALYKLTGKVANLQASDYGNFDLVDATGKVYVYGLTATQVEKNDKSFPTLGIKEGDIVTLIGTRASHNDTPQVGGPAYYVSHVGHTESTVADFLAQSVAADKWYKLSGTVTNLQTGDYGNFDLVDETGSVYVYGLTVAPVAKNDKSFPTLGIKEGDKVTLVGTRAEHKGTAQVGGPAYYISHEAGSADGGEEGGDDNTGNEGVAGTYTHIFAQNDLGANGSPSAEVTLNGVKWNFSMVDSGSKYLGWDSNESARGVQIGKSKDVATEVVLSTTGIAGTVKSIKVNTSGASDTDAKLNVTVGGAAFGSEVVLTSTATDYTLTGSASGEIVLKWTCTAKAIYIKSIEIVTE